MKNFWYELYGKHTLLYKIVLCVIVIFLIVNAFPKKAKFKYEFQKGKLWQNETLYAPFEFPLKKSERQIEAEKQEIKKNSAIYYTADSTIYSKVVTDFETKIKSVLDDEKNIDKKTQDLLIKKGKDFLSHAYKNGVMVNNNTLKSPISVIKHQHEIVELPTDKIFFLNRLKTEINIFFTTEPYLDFKPNYHTLFFDVMIPDILTDQNFTKKALDENLKKIVYTRGLVEKGQLIIVKGELVEGNKLNMLESLQAEYESDNPTQNSRQMSLLGYFILVGISIFIVMTYLKRYRYSTFQDNMKVTVILLNILFTVYLVSIVSKSFPNYVYVVPVCSIILIIKSFFDLRSAVFIFIITILLLGFIVPNSFQYMFIQIVAGSVIMLNPKDLHYRLNYFASATYVTVTYLITYIAFFLITESDFSQFNTSFLLLFLLNGIGTLFSQPLTYIFEKIFGLVSDVSLLELSDTNSKLLRELSEKAPGTFHHSLQVANLAEAAAMEIGGNALLVRVGALYHDIGKMLNPIYFTENQKTAVNPHDDLIPKQSAKIIIDHVINGIEIGRKYKLPDRIIDFIRTHHGTSLVYYFYKKELDEDAGCQQCDFRYPGPIPFSKETAILMMADSVEAASKSLKNPTYAVIDEFVERIVKKQLDDKQFMNADITLKEIERVKKVLKDKLTNIYHLRVEYPE